MAASLSLTESNALTVLRSFILSVLPNGTTIFSASIESDGTMHVTSVEGGALAVGDLVIGAGVAAGTVVATDEGGNGGPGDYTVSPPQEVDAGFLSNGVEVILGQTNRVPEPKVADFVVMTPTRRGRIETNVDEYTDAVFEGSIAGDIMTISEVLEGSIKVGSIIFGEDVVAPTRVIHIETGDGGLGTYRLNRTYADPITSQTLTAGTKDMIQPTELTVQLDVHGPNGGDNSQIISTAFRDELAATFFEASGVAAAPLHADDPMQVPFPNAEQQWEGRWTIQAHMQINPAVSVPQEFADQLSVTTIPVEAEYPAT